MPLAVNIIVAVLSFLAGVVFVFWLVKRPSFADAFVRGALLNQGAAHLRRLEKAARNAAERLEAEETD